MTYDVSFTKKTRTFLSINHFFQLHGGWEPMTGIHAALFRSELDPTDSNVDASVQLVLRLGAPRSKIMMGIPAYGNAFLLNDTNINGVGAPAVGADSIKFHDICSRVKSGSFHYRWDDAQKVPYAFFGSEWVGYDNVRQV
jgi:GH18 family chitinase